MKFVYYFLILFFSVLLFVEIINSFNNYYLRKNIPLKIEGLENNNTKQNKQDKNKQENYKPYNFNSPNGALILSQQNAGNIEVLRGRIDKLDGIKQRVDDMQQSIDSMQTQIDGLVQQQADYAQEIAGSTPPDVTGTEDISSEEIETSFEEEE